MGKLNKKYTRTNKKQNKKRRKTTRRVRVKKGGHEREDVPHYHLIVQLPNGRRVELFALFAKSAKARPGINEIDVTSATIGDLKTAIIDKEKGYSWDVTLNKSQPSWIMDPNNPGKTKPFTLFWKGKALLDDNMKIREIIVDNERLPLHIHSNEIEPIIIKLDEDLEYPSVVETERVKNEDFEDTP